MNNEGSQVSLHSSGSIVCFISLAIQDVCSILQKAIQDCITVYSLHIKAFVVLVCMLN